MAGTQIRARDGTTEHTQLSAPPGAEEARRQLLASMPVVERRARLAGIDTAILEGGSGPTLVLLHGPGAYAAHWMWVIPRLVSTHRVIAPDLPGHGASNAGAGALDAPTVLAWLGDLIGQTCASPPVLVGQLFGGALAARFAAAHGDRLRHLVLADSFGLREFQPQPEFGRAIADFLAQPDRDTHRNLWRYCAFDAEGLRARSGAHWQPFEAYNLDRARTPSVRAALSALMVEFAVPAIPAADLARIRVPTDLIWGRHDLGTPLAVAEAASLRYGWPLHVIEDAADDPPIEQPEAFLRALHAALGRVGPDTAETRQ